MSGAPTKVQLSIAAVLQKIGGGQQGCNLYRQRERTIAAVLFPAVLAGGGTVGDDVARSAAYRGDEVVEELAGQMVVAVQQIGQQDGKAALVHLHAPPIRAAIQPEILRPAP